MDAAPRTDRLGGHDHAHRREGVGSPVLLLHGVTRPVPRRGVELLAEVARG